MSEEERREGFLRRTIEPERVVASGGKPKKAKLTGKTIEGLRKSRPRIAKKIERYNEEYEKLISIAREISDEQASETPDVEAIKDNVAKFNAQAERLGKLSVQIIAFNEDDNKVSLNGVGVKAIRVPSRLTRILRSFTKAGRKKNEEYEEAMSSIKKSVTDIAKTAIDTSDDEVTVDGEQLATLGLTSDGSALTEVSDLTQGSLLDSVVKELRENHGYDVSVQEFLEDRPIEIARREEGRRTLQDVLREREAEKAERESRISPKTSKDILAIIEENETLFDAAKALHEEGYSFSLVRDRGIAAFVILDKDKKPVRIDSEDAKVGEVVRLSALWARNADGSEIENAYSEEARPYFDEMIARVGTRNLRGLSDDNIEFRNRVMDLLKSRSPLTQLILNSANKDFCEIKGIEPVEAAVEEHVESVEIAAEPEDARPVVVTDEVRKTLQESQAELSALSTEIRTLNEGLEGLSEDSDEYRSKVAERDAKVSELLALTSRIVPKSAPVERHEYSVPDLTGEDISLRTEEHVEVGQEDDSAPAVAVESDVETEIPAVVEQVETVSEEETEEERVKKAAAETAKRKTISAPAYNEGLTETLGELQIASSTENEVKEQPTSVAAPDLDLDSAVEAEDSFDEEDLSDEARDDIAFWESITHVDEDGELSLNDDVKLLTPSEAKREHHMDVYYETHADAIADQKRRKEETREKKARTILMHCWPQQDFEMSEEEVDTMISTYDCQSACELLDRLKKNAPKAYAEMQVKYEEYRRNQIQASLDRYAQRQSEGRTI